MAAKLDGVPETAVVFHNSHAPCAIEASLKDVISTSVPAFTVLVPFTPVQICPVALHSASMPVTEVPPVQTMLNLFRVIALGVCHIRTSWLVVMLYMLIDLVWLAAVNFALKVFQSVAFK